MSKRFRFTLIVLSLVVAGMFVFPTVRWWFFTDQETKDLVSQSFEQIRDYAQEETQRQYEDLLALGREDADQVLPEGYESFLEEAKYRYDLREQSYPESWTIRNTFAALDGKPTEIKHAIERGIRTRLLDLKASSAGTLSFGLDLFGGMNVVLVPDFSLLEERQGSALSSEDREDVITRSIEILSDRIDALGLVEPQIKRESGGDLIFIEIPGEVDEEQVNSFLQGKGSMSFNIVDQETTETLRGEYPGWNDDPFLQIDETLVPVGSQVFEYWKNDEYGVTNIFEGRVALYTTDQFTMDGSEVINADYNTDPQRIGQLITTFELTPEGADQFFKLTSENVDKPMAVTLDGQVRAIANINEGISGGRASINGFSAREAQDLQKILKTGALPLNFEIQSTSAVGAALGQDQIQMGLLAIAIGLGLVIVFMMLYYKGSGIIAALALIVNIALLVSILSYMGLTATLTSIAGLILTIGMSVDANVIIFERIKEERRAEKSPGVAVETGFKKGFWTILDANVTTLIAAVFLSMLSSGPIQGFAVTLSVGVLTSMFTALFVSRFFFDLVLDLFKPKNLSISWRTK